MKTPLIIRTNHTKRNLQLTLTTGVVALMSLIARPASGQTITNYPHNAAEVKQQNPGAPDGEYMIDPDGPGGNPPFSVYCYNMAGTPTEYLTLPEAGEGTNYSKYAAGGARSGTDVITRWSKLRILPATLQVDRMDVTFSVSTGELWYPPGPLAGANSIWTNFNCANAYDCIGSGSSQGRANVDLRGTPFRVDPTVQFVVWGSGAAGNASISADRKVINLQGGGDCGTCNPGGGDNGDRYMLFSFDPSLVTPAVAPTIPGSGEPQSQTPSTAGPAIFSVRRRK